MRILIIDSSKTNRDFLKYIIKHWFAETIELNSLEIEESYNTDTTMHKIKSNSFDVVFFGILISDDYEIELIKQIRDQNLAKQPLIYLTIQSNQQETIDKAIQLGANGSIEKPTDFTNVGQILNGYLKSLKQVGIHDNFFDFDEILFDDENFHDEEEFEEFGDFDEFGESIDIKLIDQFNLSHKKIPASIFFKEKLNLEYVEQQLIIISDRVSELILNVFKENIYYKLDTIKDILYKLVDTLKLFPEFIELNTSIKILVGLLDRTNEKSIQEKLTEEHKKHIAIYITSMLEDLIIWIDNVFIKKEAIDVYYINASSLNSCIELENYIKKCLKTRG